MDSKPSNYQVIARKYRPQTFANVVGQEAIVTTLKNALRFNRLAHAYLFCGCRGTGKTTLARVFAKALNCSNLSEDGEPCNGCASCLDIIAGRSLDVLEIDGASNRGIDDIRQINETIGYAPASGKYKIYIIDEVHMLTKEAFNALLKTLEEPPANVKFFFATTEPHKVLPTIISRCQRFDLNRIPFETLKKKLAWIAEDLKVSCEDDVLSLIATLSEGSLRDAESLFDQIICYAEHPITAAKVSATLGIMPSSAFFSLDKAFEEQNLSFGFELAGDIFSAGKDLSYFIDNLIEHYRSLLKLKLNSPTTFSNARLKEQYTASAALYTEEQCLYILDFLIHWQQQIGKTPFKRVSLEMILLHILRSKNRIPLPALVRRLIELEQQVQVNPTPSTSIEKISKLEQTQSKESDIQCQAPQTITTIPLESVSEEIPSVEQTLRLDATVDSQAPQTILPISLESVSEEIPSVEQTLRLEATVDSQVPQPAAEILVETPTAASLEPVETPVQPQIQTVAGGLSLEDTLMKKIREKIEAAPLIIEEIADETSNVIEPTPELPKPMPSLILTKSQWEAVAGDKESQKTISPASVPETRAAVPKENVSSPPQPLSGAMQSRYDTLVRFAAVELEGIIKKEQPNG